MIAHVQNYHGNQIRSLGNLVMANKKKKFEKRPELDRNNVAYYKKKGGLTPTTDEM